jgi:penicillin-binding protein 1C
MRLPWLKPALRLAAFAAGNVVLWLALLPRPHLLEDTSFSSCYLDRDGHLLRLGLADDDRYRVFVPLSAISPEFVEMTLLHEDRFFREHPGFNAVALARATWNALTRDGVHPGASTITMQLVRLHYGLNTRTPWGKFCQVAAALHLEMHCSKREILEAYFNLAPYGRNIEGVGAASLIYFGKEPSQLSPVEAMTLAVIPQSPARRAPGSLRHEAALRDARNLLLTQWLVPHPGNARLRDVHAMPIQVSLPRDLPFRAPHLVNEMMARDGVPAAQVRLDLDGAEQAVLEHQVAAYVDARQGTGLKNACALLVDYTTMEVRAAVGSASYGARDIQGQVDGLHMQRSPGSALKPLVYALALDQGLIHPGTLLRDAPASFNGYDPEDFDHQFAGPISAHDALIQSRNVPAVDLESRLAPGHNLYALLDAAGVRRLQPERRYGLSIALGSAEVSPEELAELYATLANRGTLRPLRFEEQEPSQPGVPLLSPEAAWLTLDILKDAPPPGATDFPPLRRDGRPVAWKTGTSFSYRDAWTAGVFDHDVLVVWVGNFNGAANSQFVGRTAAAPLFFSIVNALRAREPAPARTCFDLTPDLNLRRVNLCAASGELAGPHCPRVTTGWFIPGVSPITACDVHRQVWIDNRTGLRLAGFPARPASAHQAVLEFWSSDFARIFRAAGFPKTPPPPLLVTADSHLGGNAAQGPRILSPKSDRVYQVRLAGSHDGVLDLEAAADGANDRLYWFVDAAYVGASKGSTPIPWTPVVGRHTVRAVDENGRVDSRTVTVTAVE